MHLATLDLNVEFKRRFRSEDQRNAVMHMEEELRKIAERKHRHLGKPGNQTTNLRSTGNYAFSRSLSYSNRSMKTKVQRRKSSEALREMSVTQIKRYDRNNLQLVCV